MSTLTKELKVKITADANGLKGALNGISKDISKVSKDFEGLKKVGEGISNIGKKLTMGLTLPIAGVAGASAKLSIDFEKSFAKVSTLLDSSSTDFDKYKKDIKNASKEMGVSIDKYSEAVYQSISAGVDQAKAVEFTTQAVKLAKGGFTETATAVDLMTTIMNSYGDKAGDVNSIMDSLINTQNKGKTTVDELASSMGKIIPIANGLNVPFNTLNGAMASLTAGGIATAEATTYLKSMLNELGKGGTKVAGILKEETGKSFSELMNEGMPLSEVLGILQSNAEANGLAFNDLFGSSEAATAALALMRDGGADLDQKIKEITETTGSANEAFEKMEDTAGAKLEKAFNAMKISLIDVGDALAPLIEKFAEFVSKVADWIGKFGELNPATQNFILIVAGVLAVLGPLLMLVGGAISLFANLSIVAGALGISVSALCSPFLIAIGVIAGIIAIGYLLVSNWDWIKEKASELGQKISDTWNSICEWTSNTWNSVCEWVSNAWDTICNAVQVGVMLIGEILSGAFQIITLPWQFIWENCKDIIIPIWEAIKTYVSEKFNELKTKVLEIANTMKDFVVNKFNELKTKASEVWNNIKTYVVQKATEIKDQAIQKFQDMVSPVVDKFNQIKSKASEIFGNIKQAITDKINSAKDAVGNAINKMKSFLSVTLPFPKIKMPHFSISGKFSINPPSVPSFKVDWYSKGAIFKRPTVLGGMGIGDKHNGIGSNAEAILPINQLPKLLGLDKMQNGGVNLSIENFNNNTDKDIEYLANELAFYLSRKKIGMGGAF